jgi:flagellar protein FlbD
MIKVTRFNGHSYYINAELIETIETTPDTVITLVNGKKYVVHEDLEEIIKQIIGYRQKIFSPFRAEWLIGDKDR